MTIEQLIERMAEAVFMRRYPGGIWTKPGSGFSDRFRKDQAAVLDALTAAGMVIVPREPTEAMIRAGHHHIDWCRDKQDTSTPNHSSQKTAVGGVLCGSFCGDDLRDAYRAMTEAANGTG